MKKYLFYLSILFVGLTACDNMQEEQSSISISPAEAPLFTPDGDMFEVTVTSSSTWHINYSCSWCGISTQSGENGDKVLITVDPSDSFEERETVLTFYCGSDNKAEALLTIKQSGRDNSFSLSKTELQLSASGGEEEITVTSFDMWKLSEYPEWCAPSILEGNSGEKVTLKFSYNDTAKERYAMIVFTCGDQEREIEVSQSIDDSPAIDFKDVNFLNAVIKAGVDKNGDGKISEAEAAAATSLPLEAPSALGDEGKIADLGDIKYFTGLKELNCNNNILTKLDLNHNPKLTVLDCTGNRLASLDVTGCTELSILDCTGNQLVSLDVSGCAALTELRCGRNQFTALDVSDNASLAILLCDNNPALSSLDVAECAALMELDCAKSNLTELDLNGCAALSTLQCSDNKLVSLNLDGCKALSILNCTGNQLASLDVSGTSLAELICNKNQFVSLDVSACKSLAKFYCNENKLTSLNVSGCTSLVEMYCQSNKLTELDLTKQEKLTTLICTDNPLKTVRLSTENSLSEWSMNSLIKMGVEIIVQ